MEITREVVTVFANPATNQVHIVLSGYRLVLTTEEAQNLGRALSRLDRPPGDAPEATGEGSLATLATITDHPAANASGPRHLVRPSPAEAEAVQQRARALIQGTIREKGLSLREEHST